MNRNDTSHQNNNFSFFDNFFGKAFLINLNRPNGCSCKQAVLALKANKLKVYNSSKSSLPFFFFQVFALSTIRDSQNFFVEALIVQVQMWLSLADAKSTQS